MVQIVRKLLIKKDRAAQCQNKVWRSGFGKMARQDGNFLVWVEYSESQFTSLQGFGHCLVSAKLVSNVSNGIFSKLLS